ncbi:hypothetical protein U1Q18_026855 [Sarracenia purpurea var. burkii]
METERKIGVRFLGGYRNRGGLGEECEEREKQEIRARVGSGLGNITRVFCNGRLSDRIIDTSRDASSYPLARIGYHSLDDISVQVIFFTAKDLKAEVNHTKALEPFDSARMAALDARIQQLKGPSPIKMVASEAYDVPFESEKEDGIGLKNDESALEKSD